MWRREAIERKLEGGKFRLVKSQQECGEWSLAGSTAGLMANGVAKLMKLGNVGLERLGREPDWI